MSQPYIDGKFVGGTGGKLAVHDPSAGDAVVAEVDAAGADQFAAAIDAARAAFDAGPWPRMPMAERRAALVRLGEALAERRGELVETTIAETGCPRGLTEQAQVGAALQDVFTLAELGAGLPEWEHNELPLEDHLFGRGGVKLSVRRYEPAGVVAAITPYNFPLLTGIWKIVPALVTGCSVVLRPSPLTPLSTLALAEAAAAADLPPGVLNVLAEPGDEGARLMTGHPGVDAVSFTGSVPVGRAIAAQAAPTLKALVLELGGNNVQLHLPDVFGDLAGGVAGVVAATMAVYASHAGQACAAQSRVLVPERHVGDVLAALREAVPRATVGDPREPETLVGPLITAAHRERVEALIKEGIAAGGELVAGGGRPAHLAGGWYLEPAVLHVPGNANPAAREEAFGPVVTVQGYADVEEAVAIGNDTEYGLTGGIYSGDQAAAIAVAARLRTGTVQINTGAAGPYTPMGGYRQSGLGRERGVAGVRAFQELKHLVVGSR